jgi:serine/threonine-protein kinase
MSSVVRAKTPHEARRDPSLDGLVAIHTQIGRYKVVEQLGRGGLGAVYLARDEDLHRVVAIKLNLESVDATPERRARFRREAMAVAHLEHRNIVPIYDVGYDKGLTYIVLAYVPGGDLRQRLRGEPWAPGDAARLVVTLARAVDYAHSNGIIHRDLKPSNILIDREGTPMISDFGLAKLIGEQEEDAAETKEGVVLGTPVYMAPEQARGEIGRIGPATDIHALGVMLYELLAGRRPFQGGTPDEMLMQVREVRPGPPSQWRPDLPPALDAICLKCLEKEPERRYATAGALADDLERYLAGQRPIAAPPSLWERALGFFARKGASEPSPPAK